MKKAFQLLVLLTFFISGSYAQNIVGGEYFFDADPGISGGHHFSVTPGAEISESLTIPTTGLSAGFHNLFIRVKNENGIWSQYESRPVYIYDPSTINQPSVPLKKIVSGEWFVDTDPGIGKATSFALLADTNIIASIKMQLPTLSVGDHYLFVRVKNEDNVWSQYESQAFSICPAPPAPTAKDTTICSKTPVTLKAKGTGIVNWYTQAIGGRYLGSDTLLVDTLTITTTFYAQDSLCDISATRTPFTVNVLTNPKVIASATKTTICVGDSTQLNSTGASQVVWNLNGNEGHFVKPIQTTNYKVTGIDANGCQNTDSIKVIVNSLPSVKALANKTTVCAGDSTQLNSTGASQVIWNLNGNEGLFVKPIQTTTYKVTGTDANGCQNTDSIKVIVNSLPSVKALANKTTVCAGEEVIVYGIGATSFIWNNNVTNNITFIPTKDLTYKVKGIDLNGCENKDSIILTVKSLPILTTNVTATTIVANQQNAVYQWVNCVTNFSAISSATSQNFIPSTSGEYAVIVSANGCSDTSACVKFSMVGLNEISANEFNIYPNPSNGSFTISGAKKGDYSITNEVGTIVYEFTVSENENKTLTIDQLSNGIYFLNGENGINFPTKKIVVLN